MSETNNELEKKLPTGFFVIGENCLQDIKNRNYETTTLDNFEDEYNLYENAEIFLKGSCQLFALALHEKYGYSALRLQTETNINAHFFCQVNYKGKDIYIDVRGMTINLNDIISMYISDEDYKIVSYDFTDEKILNKDEKHGHEFAKHVINIQTFMTLTNWRYFMSSVWCWDCKNYGGGNTCYAGQNPEENSGLCLWEEPENENEDEDD